MTYKKLLSLKLVICFQKDIAEMAQHFMQLMDPDNVGAEMLTWYIEKSLLKLCISILLLRINHDISILTTCIRASPHFKTADW